MKKKLLWSGLALYGLTATIVGSSSAVLTASGLCAVVATFALSYAWKDEL